MHNPAKQLAAHPIRVLIVTPEPVDVDALSSEIMRRSALVAVTASVADAGAAVRANGFEVIFVVARAADAETTLLIQLLRGASVIVPRIFFLADPARLADHPMAIAAADATIPFTATAQDIADLAVPRARAERPAIIVPPVALPPPAAQPAAAPAAQPATASAPAANLPPSAEAEAAFLPVAETIARAAEAIARAAESIAARATPQEDAEAPAAETLAFAAPAFVEPIAFAPPVAAPPVAAPAMPTVEAPAVEVAAPQPVPAFESLPTTPHLAEQPRPVSAPASTAAATPLPPLRVEPPKAEAPRVDETKAETPQPQRIPVHGMPEPLPARPVEAPQQRKEAPKPHLATVAKLPQRTAASPEVAKADAVVLPPAAEDKQHKRRFYDRKAEVVTPGQRLSKLFFASGWFVLATAIIGLTTWPISTQAQFTLGLAALAIMTVIRKLRLKGIWRTTFLALGSTMILRYVYWRSTTTLPPFHDLINFTPGFLLFMAEMYCVLMFFISMFIIADPIERKPPPALPDDRVPTVDVYIPTYNEPSDLLATTVAAATQMDYPKDKLNIYLLDDGGTDQKCNQSDPEKAAEAIARRAELQSLALELGVTYITRAKNEHAKAGNMNNALVQTSGEIIVVFDADHAPARQFLRETVGYFSQDRKLFLVQTPHFFINPDPVEKNLQTFEKMPSENEMFYGTIQKGLDKWNGAFFCGSAALISRRALESVGGFSGLSITEDCETALDLHKRGWNSLYVDKPLIAGLQPESLVSFIGQRSRWCRGMVQILVLKNPLLARNISLKQRIAYVSSMFYWLFPIPRLIFLLSPFLYIFFGMQIFQSNAQEFFAYVTIYMLTHMTIQNYIHGSTRWPWISEAYEYVQTLYLVKGIWGVLLNPRKPTFNVTAKGLTLDSDHLSELAWPYFAMFGLILTSLVWAIWKFAISTEVDELLLIVGGWSLYNLIIAGVALGIVAERRERRKTPRLIIERRGELSAHGVTVPVKIEDASIGGMRVTVPGGRLPEGFARGTTCGLRVIPERPDFETPEIPCTIHNVSNDGGGAVYGLLFEGLRPSHFRGIADAMYADMMVFEKFRASRRAIKGITMGTLQFFWWSIYHTIRAFYYAIALGHGQGSKASDGEQLPITESKVAHPSTHTPAQPVAALLGDAAQSRPASAH